MESVCWVLAADGVEVCFSVPTFKLCIGGSLLFQQVPMVEIDGMKMVQTGTILSYIAAKYNLCGKDLKERALIDMYVGGTDGIFFPSPHFSSISRIPTIKKFLETGSQRKPVPDDKSVETVR
ncbi:glutathione S-transferase A4-like [Calypte anna]|uniref:glutathione S-transferase A4-like n=1 Tax=Calypte anna TaxID=9244 RepID=UPI0011C3F89E|nr:glutathione S-transferase A4-like [Calypte anna]